MDWKICGRKQSWPILRYNSSVYQKELQRATKASAGMPDIRAQIRILDFPKTKLEC